MVSANSDRLMAIGNDYPYLFYRIMFLLFCDLDLERRVYYFQLYVTTAKLF